jgi:hypothetical protein
VHPFHERLARVGLTAAAPYGFCLAGGYAVQAHGMVDRRSKDVDLFTSTTYQPYALSESEIGLLRARLLDWADEISGRRG